MQRKAYSYIRMSTESQLDGDSLKRQTDATINYIKQHNLILEDKLEDIGLSAHDGTNVNKGALGRFLDAVNNGKVEKGSVLIIENLDRLSRQQPLEAMDKFRQILSKGIEIHTIHNGRIYTKEGMDEDIGQLLEYILISFRAYSESKLKAERLKSSWKSKRGDIEKGKVLTSICPAWLRYDKDLENFKKIPGYCNTIEKIFDLYIEEDKGAYSISRYLNQNKEKYPTFETHNKKEGSKIWHQSYITKIINNPAVYGEFTPHTKKENKRVPIEDSYEKYYPSVIDKKRFLLAQKKKNNRQLKDGGRKGLEFSNIFSKLVYCKVCGGKVHFVNKGKPPKGNTYLRCYNAIYKNKCNCPNWVYKDFENSFFKFVTEFNLTDILDSNKSLREELLSKKTILEEDINQISNKLEVLLGGNLKSEIFYKKALELDEIVEEKKLELEEIDKELLKYNSSSQIRDYQELLEEIAVLDENLSINEASNIRRKINYSLSQILDKIVIFNKQEEFIASDEVDEFINSEQKDVLFKLGLDSNKKIEEELLKNKGKYSLTEINKQIFVYFKNGEMRTIYPFIERSYKYKETSIKDIAERLKEKNSQERLERRKSRIKKVQCNSENDDKI